MELRHLEGFIAVAEELHFGRAAARLHMAQPPLSQQIKLLERDLGAVLFERSTRSVRLTPAGEALLGPARDVLAAAGVARRSVRAAVAGEVGRVTIGFAGASSYDALPRLTREITAQLPGIDLVLRSQTYSGEALGQIASGDLDLGFVSYVERPDVSMRVISREELVVALPSSHRLALHETIDLAELAGEPFVTFPAAHGSAIHEATLRHCLTAGFAPRVAQEAPDAYNLLTLVGAGVGVALVVDSARHIQLEHVAFRRLHGPAIILPIALAWRANAASTALQRVLEVAEEVLPTPD
ncbi:LysR family transcriptional regulator [Kribbia dieselivorans]|uniref:LysR family transcriptional regulator n=1 Tax=Kribbia dieselivorans TaxID=331526 RepID=UPI00083860D7|nr:LysR family transcriptional regulator [Kribbia dieselivorans]